MGLNQMMKYSEFFNVTSYLKYTVSTVKDGQGSITVLISLSTMREFKEGISTLLKLDNKQSHVIR